MEVNMKEHSCDIKTKIRNKTEQDMILDRLNRINGQINGIRKMVEDSRYCDDILTQISAVNNSLKSLGLSLIENHMKTCVKEDIKNGKDEVMDELLKTFERFSR
jgi:CsoR family transcriptional regulator, copper-sensing transcriptional repressor